MLACDLAIAIAVADEVGSVVAQGQFDHISNWRCFGEELFDVWRKVVPCPVGGAVEEVGLFCAEHECG